MLTDVWPHALPSTPGVARALAHPPAASGGAFVDAVRIIERFRGSIRRLVYERIRPLHGSGDDGLKLNRIDDGKKSDAFCTPLD